jgi:CIC family chloride channel protein
MLGALVSQAIRKRLADQNFYEGILVQDGHHLKHVIPPRDLNSWQGLPVSAIANFHPVIISDLSPENLRTHFETHPMERFPVVVGNELKGILTRKETTSALAEKRAFKLDAVVTCRTNQTIRELQGLLIESTSQLVVVLDASGKVLGVVTLHDLLRAEVALGKNSS